MEKLSFVVQGPVIESANAGKGVYSTAQVLKSIRKYYPGSEIILSTWKGANVDGLDYDKVLLNDDPGAIIMPAVNVPYNHNRLIRSSVNGIREATNPIVVKTRADVLFVDSSILDKLKYITPISGPYTFFSHYVLSTNYYVRNPLRLHLLFHASDILLVGKKQDLELFFSAPMTTKEEMLIPNACIKMVSEQYLVMKSIEKVKNITYKFNRPEGFNVQQFMASEKYLFSNFNFFSIADLGVEFPNKLLFASRPEANYIVAETNALSRHYRKNKHLDFFSYVRAAEYTFKRLNSSLRVRVSRLKSSKSA